MLEALHTGLVAEDELCCYIVDGGCGSGPDGPSLVVWGQPWDTCGWVKFPSPSDTRPLDTPLGFAMLSHPSPLATTLLSPIHPLPVLLSLSLLAVPTLVTAWDSMVFKLSFKVGMRNNIFLLLIRYLTRQCSRICARSLRRREPNSCPPDAQYDFGLSGAGLSDYW